MNGQLDDIVDNNIEREPTEEMSRVMTRVHNFTMSP